MISLDFAAKKRKKNTRNCTKGYNCGNSCINKRLKCKRKFSDQASTYAGWLKKQAPKKKEPKKATPPESNFRGGKGSVYFSLDKGATFWKDGTPLTSTKTRQQTADLLKKVGVESLDVTYKTYSRADQKQQHTKYRKQMEAIADLAGYNIEGEPKQVKIKGTEMTGRYYFTLNKKKSAAGHNFDALVASDDLKRMDAKADVIINKAVPLNPTEFKRNQKVKFMEWGGIGSDGTLGVTEREVTITKANKDVVTFYANNPNPGGQRIKGRLDIIDGKIADGQFFPNDSEPVKAFTLKNARTAEENYQKAKDDVVKSHDKLIKIINSGGDKSRNGYFNASNQSINARKKLKEYDAYIKKASDIYKSF